MREHIQQRGTDSWRVKVFVGRDPDGVRRYVERTVWGTRRAAERKVAARVVVEVAEIIDATERLVSLTADGSVDDIAADRDRRDALLWNFTVLGEAVSQLCERTKATHAEVPWDIPEA